MKKLIAIATLATTFGAYANCVDAYQNRIKDMKAEIADRATSIGSTVKKHDYMFPIAGFISGGLGAVEIAAASAFSVGGAGPSTVGAAGAMAGMSTSALIYDNLRDKDLDELRSSQAAASNALTLLREAQAGGGEIINAMTPRFYMDMDNDISPKDIAQSMTKLSNSGEFCADDQLDNIDTIIEKTKESMI
ncbi:MAG: hypothetical protein CME64_01545 [Halobacteriovoraceae bacterium]|nr:hypothetical protein [Halobacteriovoraceae bacterium]